MYILAEIEEPDAMPLGEALLSWKLFKYKSPKAQFK